MSARLRLRAAALAVLAAALVAIAAGSGCGGGHPAPVAPESPPPPVVEEEYPPARAARVDPSTEIWVRFREPLDPATVDARHVFLKLDITRIAATITWDAAARTIRIVPAQPLRLRRTYTVELSPGLATAAGVPLGRTWFWQFTTISLRRLEHPVPADGAAGIGPFAPLSWDSTEASAGAVRYHLYLGPDSAAVAARAVTPGMVGAPYRIAMPRHPAATTLWWAVDATNLDTGEAIAGPMWRFTTRAEGGVTDSIVVFSNGYGSPRSGFANAVCSATTMNTGPTYNGCFTFPFPAAALPAGSQVAGVRLRIVPTSTSTGVTVSVQGTTQRFTGCDARFPGPPYVEPAYGELAGGVVVPFSINFLAGDRLSAHVAAAAVLGRPPGYRMVTSSTYAFYSSLHEAGPQLVIHYYRDPAPVAAR